MKKRIEQPAGDLFSEVVAEPDATSGNRTNESDVQVDSPQLVDMGAFFDESLADDSASATSDELTVEKPIIETCEPQAVELATKAIGGNRCQVDVEKLTAAVNEAFGIIAKAFLDAAKAITEAMKDPAVQEVVKAVEKEQMTPRDKTKDESERIERTVQCEQSVPTDVVSTPEPPPAEPKPPAEKAEKKPAGLLPSIVDGSPMWSIEIASTGILDGISRFGEQRKQSVIAACPTAGDLQRQIEGAGLKKVEGIGGKIAEQIAANFESWKDVNWDAEPTDTASDVVSPGQPGSTLESPPNAPKNDAATQSDNTATPASGDGGEPVEAFTGDPGSLDGLTLLGDDAADDPQAANCRKILSELVAKYGQHGESGHVVESQYQQYAERGATDAESGVPGDDCIFTDDDRIRAWAWGWVCRTLGGEPVEDID